MSHYVGRDNRLRRKRRSLKNKRTRNRESITVPDGHILAHAGDVPFLIATVKTDPKNIVIVEEGGVRFGIQTVSD